MVRSGKSFCDKLGASCGGNVQSVALIHAEYNKRSNRIDCNLNTAQQRLCCCCCCCSGSLYPGHGVCAETNGTETLKRCRECW